MQSIGTRDLKAHLSAYLRAASEGETIVVTRHGIGIAVLRPLGQEFDDLRRLLGSGQAHWSGRRPGSRREA